MSKAKAKRPLSRTDLDGWLVVAGNEFYKRRRYHLARVVREARRRLNRS